MVHYGCFYLFIDWQFLSRYDKLLDNKNGSSIRMMFCENLDKQSDLQSNGLAASRWNINSRLAQSKTSFESVTASSSRFQTSHKTALLII